MKKAIKLFFPIFVSLTYIFLILESYFYIGVFYKYIPVNSRVFIVISIISGLLMLREKISKVNVIIFKLNLYILPMVSAIYLFMQFMEAKNFRNFVFSTYHLQPTNFLGIVVFSFLLQMLYKLSQHKYLLKPISVSKSIAVIIFGSILMFEGLTILDNAIYSNIYIATHLKYTYDQKMSERWGVYYYYIKFVKENTPENSSILVPPQETPWYSTGNVGLNRYFLFPRNMGNGRYDDRVDILKYDYVMLVWGEWNNAPEYRYAWPKVSLKAEKIIYFDPVTHKTIEYLGDYIPPESMKHGLWGLIKLKK